MLNLQSITPEFLVLVAASSVLGLIYTGLLGRRLSKLGPYLSAGGRAAVAFTTAGRSGQVTQRQAIPLPGEMTRGLDARDREFLPAALELVETPASPVRIAGIWLICGLLMTTILWAYFGELDIHAIAQGRIQPSGRSKVIQSLEPGKVVAVRVENGSKVQAGDVLVELDPTETGADREAQKSDLEAMRAEAARRRTAIKIARQGDSANAPQIAFDRTVSDPVRLREMAVMTAELSQLRSSQASLAAQLAEHNATVQKLTANLAARERSITLARERVQMRSSLNDQGSMSRALVIEVQSQLENLLTTQVGEQGQLIETQAQIKTTERKVDETITQFIADQNQKLAEAERKADRLAQDLIKATAKNERANLKAPISGTVQQLAVTTVGQVVGSGQSLMTIVPIDGAIEIEALVQNQDIGFIEVGQSVVVKVEAFPFTRFGTINGTVLKVSRDAVEEREAQGLAETSSGGRGSGAPTGTTGRGQNLVFPTTVRLDRTSIDVEGKSIPLSAGMAVTVEIRTGQRRAIDYVLSPLREVASASGKER